MCLCVSHSQVCVQKLPLSFGLRNEERKWHYYTARFFPCISGTGLISLPALHGWYVCTTGVIYKYFSKFDFLH